MLRSVQAIFTRAIKYSKINIDQTRSTFILRRRNEARLSKLGGPPRKLKRREYYYELVEDTIWKKLPTVELLLLKNVKGVGNVGDIIQTNTTKAYEYFILTGAGILATPENLNKYPSLKKHDAVPVETQNLILKLQQTPVPVFLHEENEWKIESWHIKLSLRKIGVICNEDCIKIPEKTISGPNIDLEKKDFPITITINKKYNVVMRCRLFHQTFTESNFHIAFNPKFYLDPIKAIFPEDQSLLEKIPIPQSDNQIGILLVD